MEQPIKVLKNNALEFVLCSHKFLGPIPYRLFFAASCMHDDIQVVPESHFLLQGFSGDLFMGR